MKAQQIPLSFSQTERRPSSVQTKGSSATERAKMDPSSLPHFRSIVHVTRYLKEHGHLKSASEMHTDVDKEALRWEQILSGDLEEAKKRNAPSEEIDELRKLIFAISWDMHERPELATLLHHVDRLGDEVKKRASVLGGRGSSPDDEREYLEEYRPQVEKIRRAIQSNACGSDAAEALVAMENFIVQNSNAKLLEDLRPVRDQIYYQSVYAPWCETAPHELH